jgi:hypothetical protein
MSDAPEFEIMAGHLVVAVDGCTCDGGGDFPHRPECGYEPVIDLADLTDVMRRQAQDEPVAKPLNPVLAEKLHKYGLAKCVYAAAHDIEPWTVDETDGGYADVCELIAEDWNATLEPLALALGMSDDSDYAAIVQRVAELAREVSRVV